MKSQAAAAVAALVLACSSTLRTTSVRDERATVQLEALSRSSAESTGAVAVHEAVDVGRSVTVETWAEPQPDGGAPVAHRRVTRVGPTHAERQSTAEQTTHAEASSELHVDAGSSAHVEARREETSRPSLGFQLWLFLLPLGVALVALAVWRFRPWAFWTR